jgi:hypothetical protein
VPEKYLKGLSKEERKKRIKEILKKRKLSPDDPKAYQPKTYWETGKNPNTGDPYKTEKSKHTKNYEKMYKSSKQENYEKALKNKSKETGISYGILKEVYDRGLAAWRTGHRPGVTQHQWAMARVNSFTTKGKTWSTADKDLAKKVKNA